MRNLKISHMPAGILIFTCIFICIVFSTKAAELDTSFNPVLSAPGAVRGIIPLPENRILIYGTFATVNGIARKNVAIVRDDGSLDQSFQVQNDIDVEQIHAAAVQDDGKILIGGYIRRFSASGIQSYIFRLNADGSLDTGFKTGSYSSIDGINGVVRTIKTDQNGKILVGGEFTSPGNNFARLNSDGTLDETFDTGAGPNGAVTHIALQSTGDVVIGGYFQQVNGITKKHIARLNNTGGLYTEAFGDGISYGDLLALAVQPDNRILVGGSRDAGMSVKILERYSAEGQPEADFSSGVENQLYEITSIVASQDYIFAGGWNPVMYFSGQPTDHDASFYVLKISDGSFHSYLNFKGKPTEVNAMALRSDGSVVAGGSFIQRDDPYDEDFYAGLVRMAVPYYEIDKSFRPAVGGQSEITALGVQGDGQILAGGIFYRANDKIQLGLTRLNQDGSSGTDLVPISMDVGQVNSLLIQEDGRLVAAGYFRRVEEGYIVKKEEIALLEPDGIRIAGAEINGVRQMVRYPGGKIVAVYSGFPGVVRLNPDMSVDPDFNPGEGISRSVQPDYEMDRLNAVEVQPDGKILIAGSFSSFSGEPAENIIRLNGNGSRDTSFVSPGFTVFNYRSEVFSIALQPDGRILLGGRYSTVGGIPESTVARINSDGTVDSSFQSAFADQGGTAYSVRVQTNGKILVGGDLQIFDEDGIFNSLVRLNYDGSRDRRFNVSISGAVKTIYRNDEYILAGGAISAADGTPRQGLVRYMDQIGEVNPDDGIDLSNAIIILKNLSGDDSDTIDPVEDINNDGRLGLPEAIHLLRKAGGM